MTVVSSLTVQIGANTSGLQQGLNTAQSQVRAFGRNADGSLIGPMQALKGINTSLTAMGLGFLPAVGAVGLVGAALKGSIGAAIEYEAAFANVRKTVDASEGELSKLSDTLRAMATGDSPVSSLENSLLTLTEIAATAGQLGIATEDIAGFTEQMAVLGVATDLTANEAAVFAARFANVTQMDISKVSLLGDALVTLGNNMATTESEIAGFAARAAPLANFGWDPADILGYSAALSALGVRAELGGTNLIKTVNEMTTAVALGGPKLAGFAEVAGVTAEQFKELAGQDSQAAFQKFITGLANLDADQQIIQLNKLGVTSVEQISLLQRMAGGLDTVTMGLNLAADGWEGNNAAMKEAAAKADTSAGKIEHLKNNLNDLGVEVGNFLMPVIDVAVTVTAQAVQAGTDIFREARKLGETLGGIIGEAVVPIIVPSVKSNIPPDRAKDSIGKALENFFVNNVLVVGSPVRISLQNIETMLAAADTLDKVRNAVTVSVAGMKPVETLVRTAVDLIAPGAAEMIPKFNALIADLTKKGPSESRAELNKIYLSTPIAILPDGVEVMPTGNRWVDSTLKAMAGVTNAVAEAAQQDATQQAIDLGTTTMSLQYAIRPDGVTYKLTGDESIDQWTRYFVAWNDSMRTTQETREAFAADVDITANLRVTPSLENGDAFLDETRTLMTNTITEGGTTTVPADLAVVPSVNNAADIVAGVQAYLQNQDYDTTVEANVTVMAKIEQVYTEHPEFVPPTKPDGTPMQRPVPGYGTNSDADGNSYIPFDGYLTQLHRGERVLTASQNEDYTFGRRGGGQQVIVNLTTFGNNEQEAVERFRRAFREGGY